MDTRSDVASPVVTSVIVPLPPDDAFALFTTGMGRWWPLGTHSISADTHEGAVAATDVTMGARVGGRIVESMGDGTSAEWGEVLEWDPPRRVAFTWNPTLEDRPSTHVAVTFSPADEGTRVELVHTGWDRLGERGERMRRGYEEGWPIVLGRFTAAAG
jgi:uncharacterized protein YndB with AHSA1/START domain